MTQTACRICQKLYDGTKHCCVNACRNCAMFFKRSHNLAALPKCRNGTDDCELNNKGNVKCTSCRYKKCLEEGMSLQTTRRNVKPGTILSTSRDSQDIVLVNEMALIIPEKMPSLKRFCYYYANCVTYQRKFELDMLLKDGVLLENSTANRKITRISQARCNLLFTTSDLFGFFDLLRPGYTSFAMIDAAEQFVIFQKLLFPIINFSTLFRTLRTFREENSRRVLITELMYLDLDDMTGFLDHKTLDPMDARLIQDKYHDGPRRKWNTAIFLIDLARCQNFYLARYQRQFVVYWGRQLDSALRFMRQMNITDVEFLVVFSLTLWEEKNFNGTELFRVMAEKQRSLILKDLHYYYVHILCVENYVERVMNIMQLCRIIQDNQKFEAESFRLLKLFNYYGDYQVQFLEEVMEVSE